MSAAGSLEAFGTGTMGEGMTWAPGFSLTGKFGFSEWPVVTGADGPVHADKKLSEATMSSELKRIFLCILDLSEMVISFLKRFLRECQSHHYPTMRVKSS